MIKREHPANRLIYSLIIEPFVLKKRHLLFEPLGRKCAIAINNSLELLARIDWNTVKNAVLKIIGADIRLIMSILLQIAPLFSAALF